MSAALAIEIDPEPTTRTITCTLREALFLLTLERDLPGVLQCATLALNQGSETERAVAVSALMVFDDQIAANLRSDLVRLLGWDSIPEHSK